MKLRKLGLTWEDNETGRLYPLEVTRLADRVNPDLIHRPVTPRVQNHPIGAQLAGELLRVSTPLWPTAYFSMSPVAPSRNGAAT